MSAVRTLTLVLFVNVSLAFASQDGALQLRAMFIYNFANFVEWPDKAFLTADSPINICLYGEVPFLPYLQPLGGTLVGERQLTVVRYEGNSKTRCHMLFVGKDKQVLSKPLFESANFLYVLSVAEQTNFLEAGGIINILSKENQISFEIDLQSAKEKGLFISSDLLSLAKNIKRLN